MKKSTLFFAILLVVATVSVAVVSCKKETQRATLNPTETLQAFNPLEIEDMNAYLKDFKQKMQSATKGDDEALSLEDAAWHLSSLANFEFANANVEWDDIRFDTLYSQVNITNGTILLRDLAEAYQSVSLSIDKLNHSLTLDNKHFRFINTTVSENGIISISLITTYNIEAKNLEDHCWYYDDIWMAQDSCLKYIDYEPTYPASTIGMEKLQKALNLVESHQTVNVFTPNRVYYTFTFDTTFYYRNVIDPFGSPNYMNSRLFANDTYLNLNIGDRLCYLFDSALELGYSNCPSNQNVVSWTLDYFQEEPFPEFYEQFWKEHYTLTVGYGQKHEIGSLPGQNDE